MWGKRPHTPLTPPYPSTLFGPQVYIISNPLTGADPEILKGGCTKLSGPELPYSGFDPFLNLL